VCYKRIMTGNQDDLYNQYVCLCTCAGINRRINKEIWEKIFQADHLLLIDSLKLGKQHHEVIAGIHLDKLKKLIPGRRSAAAYADIIKMLSEHLRMDSSPLVKHTAVALLSELSRQENLRKKIGVFIPSFIALLRSKGNSSTTEHVVAVLGNLAKTKRLRNRIVAAGVLPLLTRMIAPAMKGKPDLTHKVRAQASKALFSLCITPEAAAVFLTSEATAEQFGQFVVASLGMTTVSNSQLEKTHKRKVGEFDASASPVPPAAIISADVPQHGIDAMGLDSSSSSEHKEGAARTGLGLCETKDSPRVTSVHLDVVTTQGNVAEYGTFQAAIDSFSEAVHSAGADASASGPYAPQQGSNDLRRPPPTNLTVYAAARASAIADGGSSVGADAVTVENTNRSDSTLDDWHLLKSEQSMSSVSDTE